MTPKELGKIISERAHKRNPQTSYEMLAAFHDELTSYIAELETRHLEKIEALQSMIESLQENVNNLRDQLLP